MEFRLLSVEEVLLLHERVLNPGELEGVAKDKSIEGALSRIDFRLQYGMITDVYDLAAMYAVAVAQAHAFNDGNKRTAHATMEFILMSHQARIAFNTQEVGDFIIKVAQGHLDEIELAAWLREQAR